MRTIFLDLDGVMADFDGDFKRFTGMDSAEYVAAHGRKGMWGFIYSRNNFFRNLPACEGAIEFYRSLLTRGISPIILTACPSSNYESVARQKKTWVREWLGKHVMVLPVDGGESKPHFMQNPGDVLIDDYKKNVTAWSNAGGIGIHHTGNFGDTLDKLNSWGI